MNNLYLEKLLFKIKNAPDYETLFCLEEAFNQIGLTLRCTAKDRMILCKIIEGAPKATAILEDYMFLGTISERTQALSERIVECLCNFVMNNAAAPAKLEDKPRKWHMGIQTYEHLMIVNEDVQHAAQCIID